ncbi:hypothetical protein [Isoptericola sp. NPDC057391]|uniref:hypothetical protein n=1 Tax=Isoptericola sp. NPDC057391 TaxID=3346117 RepID=UPI00362FFA2D
MTQEQPTPGAGSAGATDDLPADALPVPGPTPGAPAGAPTDTGTDPRSGSGLDELEGLDDLPVAEHVARFTTVHDTLRARLDRAPDAGRDDGPDAGPRR